MVSTHLKNISQIVNLPQVGVKIKNIWNHHLANENNKRRNNNPIQNVTSLTNLPGSQVIIDPPWVAHIPYHLGFQKSRQWRLSSEYHVNIPMFTSFLETSTVSELRNMKQDKSECTMCELTHTLFFSAILIYLTNISYFVNLILAKKSRSLRCSPCFFTLITTTNAPFGMSSATRSW